MIGYVYIGQVDVDIGPAADAQFSALKQSFAARNVIAVRTTFDGDE